MTGFKKLIFWQYLCCGILAGLVVFTMPITGVVFTNEKQITRWADGLDVSPRFRDAQRLGPVALLQERSWNRASDRLGHCSDRVPQ